MNVGVCRRSNRKRCYCERCFLFVIEMSGIYNVNSANIKRKRKISGNRMQRLYACFKHLFSSSFRKGEKKINQLEYFIVYEVPTFIKLGVS